MSNSLQGNGLAVALFWFGIVTLFVAVSVLWGWAYAALVLGAVSALVGFVAFKPKGK